MLDEIICLKEKRCLAVAGNLFRLYFLFADN